MNGRNYFNGPVANLISLVCWGLLFLFALYQTVAAMVLGRPYTILHVIATVVLFLVVVRIFRRYRASRSQA